MTGSIEEDDLTPESRRVRIENLYLVSANVLGDATGLAAGDIGFANGIEQRSLAVVNVAHDGHDRRTGMPASCIFVLLQASFHQLFGMLLKGDHVGVCPKLAGDFRCQL